MARKRTEKNYVLSCCLLVLITCVSVCISEEEVVAEADEMAKRIEEESKKVEAQSNAMVSAIDKNSKNVEDADLEKQFEEASKRVDNVMDKSEEAVDEKAQNAEELENEAERKVEDLGRKIEENESSRKRSVDNAKSGKMPIRRTYVTYKVDLPSEPSIEQQVDGVLKEGERMLMAIYKNREKNSEPMGDGKMVGEAQSNMKDDRDRGNLYNNNYEQLQADGETEGNFQDQEIQESINQNNDNKAGKDGELQNNVDDVRNLGNFYTSNGQVDGETEDDSNSNYMFGNVAGAMPNTAEYGMSPGNYYTSNEQVDRETGNNFQDMDKVNQEPIPQNDNQKTGHFLNQVGSMERFSDGSNSASDYQDDTEKTDKNIDQGGYPDTSGDELNQGNDEEEANVSTGGSLNVDEIYTVDNQSDTSYKNTNTTKVKEEHTEAATHNEQPVITLANEVKPGLHLILTNKTKHNFRLPFHQHRQNDKEKTVEQTLNFVKRPQRNRQNSKMLEWSLKNHSRNSSMGNQFDKQHHDQQNVNSLDLPSKNYVDKTSPKFDQLHSDLPSKNKTFLHSHGKNTRIDNLEHFKPIDFDLVSMRNTSSSRNNTSTDAADKLMSGHDTIKNLGKKIMDEINDDYLKKDEHTKKQEDKELSDLGALPYEDFESQWRKLEPVNPNSQKNYPWQSPAREAGNVNGEQKLSLTTSQEIQFLQNERPGVDLSDKSVVHLSDGIRKAEIHKKLKKVKRLKYN